MSTIAEVVIRQFSTKAFGLFHGIFACGSRPGGFRLELRLTLSALLLAAVTFGGVFIAVVQAQDADGAITGLTLASDSPGELTVSWDMPSPAPTDYRVDWAKSGENYQSWRVDEGHVYPEGSVTTATITDLEAGVEYKVRMRARYNQGEHANSPWSGPWQEAEPVMVAEAEPDPTPEPTTAPRGAVTGLTALSTAPHTLSITWNAVDPEPSDYRVMWAKEGDDPPTWRDKRRNAYPTTTSHTVTGLAAGKEYRLWVRARYNKGDYASSPWSGPFAKTTARVTFGPPGKPSGLTVSGVTHEQLTLRWDDPGNLNITGYRIMRAVGGGSPEALVSDTGNANTEYADTGLQPETAYRYTVIPLSPDGPGPASDPASATTSPPEIDPSLPRPVGLTASFDQDGRVRLDWDDPGTDAITGYRILRGPDADSLAVIEANTGSRVSSWTDRSADGGATYAYAVQARTADALSEVSDTVVIATLTRPNGLTAYGMSAGIGLTWSRAGNRQVSGYQVLRGPDPDSLAVIVDDTGNADNFHVDQSPEPDTAYVYAVRPRNRYGVGPLSETVETRSLSLPEPEAAFEVFADNSDGALSTGGHIVGVTAADPGASPPRQAGNRSYAVSFTTSGDAAWYSLEHVAAKIGRTTGLALAQVGIHLDDEGSPSADALYVAYAQVTASSDKQFDFPDDSLLDPGLTYWVVFEELSGSGTYELLTAPDGDEASDTWPISDTSLVRDSLAANGNQWRGTALKPIAISLGGISAVTQRQATTPPLTLAGNLDQPSQTVGDPVGEVGGQDFEQANSFTTGNHQAGYTLSGVKIVVLEEPFSFGGEIRAAIYSNGADGRPGDSLYVMDLAANPRKGALTLDAPAGITLTPNTTYWLVIDVTDDPSEDSFRAAVTDSSGQDRCTEWNWSIGDVGYHRVGAGAIWTERPILKFAIIGEPVSGGAYREPFCRDLPAGAATKGRFIVNGTPAQGRHHSNTEFDWYAIDLVAGVDYQFDNRAWSSRDRMLNSSDRDDPYGDDGDAFTTHTGFHVGIYDSDGAHQMGVKSLRMSSATPGNPSAYYYDSSGSQLMGFDTMRMAFRPAASGTYYVAIGHSGWIQPDYVYRLYARADDAPADTTTTLSVEPGGVLTNHLMLMAGDDIDVDWVRVSLEANRKYQFAYHVNTQVGSARHTAIIEGIYDSGGTRVPGDAGAVLELDFRWFNTRVFTPPSDGDYYIAVSSKGYAIPPETTPRTFIGTYGKLHVWSDDQGPSDESDGGDLLDPEENDLFTRGHVANDDRAASGRIASPGDADLFSVWFEQGTRYQVVLDGSAVRDDPDGAIAGALRLDVQELHMKPPNEGHMGWTLHPFLAEGTATGSKCVALVYEARVTGIHWLAVSAPGGGTGNYRLIVSELFEESDVPTGDIPADRTSIVTAAPGAPVTGTIDSAGDRDWFRMPIISNERVYLMEVKGADTEDGTLTHSRITGVYDAHGNLIRYSGVPGQFDTESDSGLTPNNAAIMFTPPAKGTYFLEVTGDEEATGTYTALVRDITDTTVSEGINDFGSFGNEHDSPAYGYISPGKPATGTVGPTQVTLQGETVTVGQDDVDDVYRLNVQAGRRYRLVMTTLDAMGNPAQDGPYLELWLFPMAASPEGYDPPDDEPDLGPWPAGLEFVGQFYAGVERNNDFVNATLEFTALPTLTTIAWGGSELPAVWHAFPQESGDGTQRYSITLTDITDLEDESELGSETTTGTVEVGGSVTGEIDAAHDADWFRVDLKAGTTYRIRMRGSESDGGTLADPYLRVIDDSDVFTFISPPVNDDKSGTERDSEITWSPQFNGDYFIEANTKTSGTGTYTIEVEVVTGGLHITGTARQGETLTADTSMIADPDGVTGASYTFQWVRVTGSLFGRIEENIPGATGSAYVPVSEDVGNRLKVLVTYTDDAGNEETVFVISDVVDSGLFISGTAREGETLTADTSMIADPDGVTGASYTFQWVRVAGILTENDIPGAIGSTYVPVGEDVGNWLKVRVTFTDDAGNDETRISNASDKVRPR